MTKSVRYLGPKLRLSCRFLKVFFLKKKSTSWNIFLSWMVKGWLAVRHFLLHLQLGIALSCRWHSMSTNLWENKEWGWWGHQQRPPCSMLPVPHLPGGHRWEQATVVISEFKLPHSPIASGITVPNNHYTYTYRAKYFRPAPMFFKAQKERRHFGTYSRMQPSCFQGGATTLQNREMLISKLNIC